MAVNYLQDYLGIDPNDYSAMEQRIAGVSPVGQSILPQAPVLPRASIMDESDFAAATAPLMGRVYQREAEGRERAEDLANQLQGLQTNLAEITNLRDIAVQDYQEALQQQDVIRQQASENQAMKLEEQRNQLLAEREGIITTLEQDFGVQRSELESVIGGLEGQVGDLTSKVGELESVKGSLEGQINDLSSQMQALEVEKQDALAQQDVIRAEAAQSQQDALAQQGEQFATERSALEQQIADLTAQVGQQPPADMPPSQDVLLDARRKELEDIGYDAADVEEILERDQQRGLENVTSNVLPDLIGSPDRIQDMIDNMSAATGEGGLPEGYSYTSPQDMAYAAVPPEPGFRYAYGPDGDRIQVPDNKPRIDRPLPPPPLPPKIVSNDNDRFRRDREREKLVPPKMLPPKRSDQLFIDDRSRFIDDRAISPFEQAAEKLRNSIGPRKLSEEEVAQIPPEELQRIQERVNTGPITIMGTTLSQEDSDRIRAGSEGGLKGIVNRSSERLKNNPNTIRRGGFLNRLGPSTTTSSKGPLGIGGPLSAVSKATTTPSPQMSGAFLQRQVRPPQAPAITPPRRQPMSVGGVGGISGRRSMRPMMRAGGGAISQAIADLQNRLR